jgi:hypothetical protein
MKANFQKCDWELYFININPDCLKKYKCDEKWYISLIITKNLTPKSKIDKYIISIHPKNIRFKKRFNLLHWILTKIKKRSI